MQNNKGDIASPWYTPYLIAQAVSSWFQLSLAFYSPIEFTVNVYRVMYKVLFWIICMEPDIHRSMNAALNHRFSYSQFKLYSLPRFWVDCLIYNSWSLFLFPMHSWRALIYWLIWPWSLMAMIPDNTSISW